MELTNHFTVPANAEKTWEVFTDVERVASCMPGAQLTEINGEEYLGIVKVKVGPIRAQYKGTAHFIEVDVIAKRLKIKGEARDTRGQGSAGAIITLELSPDKENTQVAVHADLHITGKVAQFGRNVLADVSERLITEFARNLENEVAGLRTEIDSSSHEDRVMDPTGEPPTNGSGTSLSVNAADEDSYLDLANIAGTYVARFMSHYGVVGVVFLLGWILGRRRKVDTA